MLIVPTADWRGRYDGGCVYYTETTLLRVSVDENGTFQKEAGDREPGEERPHCVKVPWPAQRTFNNFAPRRNEWMGHEGWNGSLVLHGRDASGMYYRRNRFYDPGTGRFTQEDPIGIAGGLNVYGYANGDPVSYGDPYGLCPECDEYWLKYAAEGLRQGGVGGTLKAIVGVGASTILEFFGINDLWRAAAQVNEGQYAQAAATAGLAIVSNLPGGKVGKAANLVDGMKLHVDDALDAAIDFLGTGYREASPGRFLSGDGLKQVRMGVSDITGAHGGGPHMNFETLAPNPKKPGKNMVVENLHIYLEGK